MLRAIVGFCVVVTLCGVFSQPRSAWGQVALEPGHSSGTVPLAFQPPAVVGEQETEIESRFLAAELPAIELPGEPAVTHLVMGRIDHTTNHLQLLLTCGRLLI